MDLRLLHGGQSNGRYASRGIKGARHELKALRRRLLPQSGQSGGRKGSSGGFASDKVGKDGLTGKERAVVAGRKGGKVSRRTHRGAQAKEYYYDGYDGPAARIPKLGE